MNAKRNPALESGARQSKKRERQFINNTYYNKNFDSEILNTFAQRYPRLVIRMILRSTL